MEEVDLYSPTVNAAEREARVLETFHKSFEEVQTIFNQNSLLIREISRNQKNGNVEGVSDLARNIGLIRELNSNMGQVVQVYANISVALSKSMEEDNSSLQGGRTDASTHSKS